MIITKKELAHELRELKINERSLRVPVYTFGTAVVGSGAAGLNCADLLSVSGQSVAVITEGISMGTSRNTGSDKQTYYKLTLSGDTPDSVGDMAKSLFDGGAMHGDLALREAAGSTRAFMRLVELGVPFPRNEYGEFAGYQTDHDTRTRATSCGPLTSKYMTEALERAVRAHDVPIFDGHRVVRILTESGRAIGVASLCTDEIDCFNEYGLTLILANNIVWATGGPSAIYAATVYPESQTCAHGIALEAGAAAVNVTESQYGLASVKFRWNLSGTYQQVLPRYVSTLPDGSDEREFLDEYFDGTTETLTAIFRKGYQWPFDPAKLGGGGSSMVDIAVFCERQKGRRVFMDFRRNPSPADKDGTLDFSLTSDEVHTYLENSGALLATPIERLAKMNTPAIELYMSHGIDLYSEPLEIDMCAQHNNGGFSVDMNYESMTLPHFFVIGEAAGVFGIHRPGGSALNSTQVGSCAAAERISEYERDRQATLLPDDTATQLSELICLYSKDKNGMTRSDILKKRAEYAKRMSECGAFIRSETEIGKLISEIKSELADFAAYTVSDTALLIELLINRDILITQLVYLSSILEYIQDGGMSRGSYLILRKGDALPNANSCIAIDTVHRGKVCEVLYTDGEINAAWKPVRPIPTRDNWFENVYNSYRKRFSE
ncbi:MAG: FAD-binding protein [Clostridia bacterium]|nr:FAD-binding protein [Clostridia bacterium]